jgi:hypothetical protein
MNRELVEDTDFTPLPVRDGDELFQNGIFVFNVTRILEHIDNSPDTLPLEKVGVDDFCFSRINESHVDSVDISRPVVLAEISPGRYNVIDGNHRMEKARRSGVTRMKAYRLTAHQHAAFLTSKKAYHSYVAYWNAKLQEMDPPVPVG